jgi:hypothetical protein
MTSNPHPQNNYIYIGPTCPRLGLKQYTLYLDSKPPESLQEYMDKTPLLRSLYIATSDLGTARRNLLRNKTSVESLAYGAFLKIVNQIPR